ncbi:hypothetical protein LCGC14_0882810 [marine sediment metagenome]|uniref:Uncharacterized protein n=1 Tax=marine sediment metagenome TaxID=412755 RepID=A0A0F9PM25_9ZZZZ
MKSKEVVTVTVKVKVPFYSYDKESMNARAAKQIVQAVKDHNKDQLFIGLYVEKDADGVAYIEDCTQQITVTVVDTKRKKQ